MAADLVWTKILLQSLSGAVDMLLYCPDFSPIHLTLKYGQSSWSKLGIPMVGVLAPSQCFAYFALGPVLGSVLSIVLKISSYIIHNWSGFRKSGAIKSVGMAEWACSKWRWCYGQVFYFKHQCGYGSSTGNALSTGNCYYYYRARLLQLRQSYKYHTQVSSLSLGLTGAHIYPNGAVCL